VYWTKAGGSIQVGYDLTGRERLLDDAAVEKLKPFSAVLGDPAATLADLADPGFEDEAHKAFMGKYEQLPIVNPTKWKFYETVYEEHYYQMLRLLSYELEKPNAVLISFGFSFADEHILNLVMRSLSNPGLQVFVCCFSADDHATMREKFKGHRNVQCLVLEDGRLDFTAFNEKMLVWPDATRATAPVAGAAADEGGTPVANPEAGDPV
jgi:hypothetical protein